MAIAQPETPRLGLLADRLETVEALDAPADTLASAIKDVLHPGPVKDALSGSWLGHPLHPLLTDVVIAAWASASVLDFAGGREAARGADKLVGFGILASLPTAVTGASDWADTVGGARRLGVVHAAANVVALTLHTASYLARRRGRRARAVALSLAANGALGVGGFLGGHLAYARGIGVNRTAFEPALADWTQVAEVSQLPEGRPHAVEAGGVELMLLRRGDSICALSNHCPHRGGRLSEGEIGDGVVTCPLHGSRFRLEDGSVERGPATNPAPAYETRVRDGRVELRLAELYRRASA